MAAMTPAKMYWSRRDFLRSGVAAAGVIAIGSRPMSRAFANGRSPLLAQLRAALDSSYGALLPPNADGLSLPPGFSSRIVARADEIVGSSSYAWHRFPDGGACFDALDGGWIYASNSEIGSGAGGVGAIRFDAAGNISDAYGICSGTNRNCAGGPTPWGTWISCEEVENGRAVECDPFGIAAPQNRDALGWFYREAVAVDPLAGHLYHTEDRTDGKLYRTRHANFPNLDTGILEAAVVGPGQASDIRTLNWVAVPNPNPGPGDPFTRAQVPAATVFTRGEGMWYHDGFVYFSTTSDNRIWCIDCANQTIQAIYDRNATMPIGIASGVDNICVSAAGEILIAEDGGNMEIVLIAPEGDVLPLVQIDHTGSEVTGPAFSPDGTRLYFSSQRGPSALGDDGVTFEVTGPFRRADAIFRDGFETVG